MSEARVLVIGGGISGLAAAVELAETTNAHVELWEAGPRLGGKIATSPFAGLDHIDEGADAYLTRVPHAVAFAQRVGVDGLTSPSSGDRCGLATSNYTTFRAASCWVCRRRCARSSPRRC